MVTLNCIILGQATEHGFQIDIAQDKTTSNLKLKVKAACSAFFRDIDASFITLYKLRVPLPYDNELSRKLENLDLEQEDKLTRPVATILELFGTPLLNHAHVIVLPPNWPQISGKRRRISNEEPDDEVTARRRTMEQIHAAPTPSHVARSVKTMLLEQHKNPLYNGIPASLVGPPLSIYEPIFATIVDKLRSTSSVAVDDDTRRKVSDFMAVANLEYQTEHEYQAAVITPLGAALGLSFSGHVASGGGPERTTESDALVVCASGVEVPGFLAHVEFKLTIGNGGDGALQTALSLRKHLAQKEYSKLIESSSCPSILITVAGPYIAFAGFICTEVCITQPFTTFVPLFLQPGRESAQVQKLSQCFTVFKDCFEDLRSYYLRIKRQQLVPTTLLPKPTYQPNEILEPLVFKKRLRFRGLREGDHSRYIFCAQYGDKPVVVKFGERYGDEAHRLLANAGLAPKLYACVKVGGNLTMAVMEYVEAKDAASEFGYMPLPKEVVDKLREALGILQSHEPPLVFGDLRRPNILVSKDTSEGDGEWVTQLVDFTWAGREGVDCYPPNINMDHDWHRAVTRSGRMRCEHDDYRLHLMAEGRDRDNNHVE